MTPLIRPAILLPAHYGIISLIPCLIKVFPLFLQDISPVSYTHLTLPTT